MFLGLQTPGKQVWFENISCLPDNMKLLSCLTDLDWAQGRPLESLDRHIEAGAGEVGGGQRGVDIHHTVTGDDPPILHINSVRSHASYSLLLVC